jgi:methylase of polypeptide subunit release factors
MEPRVPARGTIVSAVAYLDNARDWARRLEDAEAERAGLPVEEVRPQVAGRLGIAPGTFTSLRKNRLKSISAYAYDRLNKAAEALIARQIVWLQHELELTRQQVIDPRSDHVAALEALLARARRDAGLTAPPDGEDQP